MVIATITIIDDYCEGQGVECRGACRNRLYANKRLCGRVGL